MSANFVEELVGEYYKAKGYLVNVNYWFPFTSTRTRKQNGKQQEYQARSWSDIDVLAIGEKELLVIQVKAIINEPKAADKISDFFKKTEKFLKEGKAPGMEDSIDWWTKGKKIKNIVVYEFYSPPKYINQLKTAGIDVYLFSEFFEKIIKNSDKREGFKEENAPMRMIHFLNHNKYLNLNSIAKKNVKRNSLP